MSFVAGQRVTAAELNLNTIQMIQSQSLSGTTASVTFSNIPSGYNNLEIVWRARSDTAANTTALNIQMNGDTANHYIWEMAEAQNNTIAGTTSGGPVTVMRVATIVAASGNSGYFASGRFTIGGASDGVNTKTVVGIGTAQPSTANAWTGTYGGLAGVNAVVTSITILPGAGNFIAGTYFTLYGSA